jgi:hypothetical protein
MSIHKKSSQSTGPKSIDGMTLERGRSEEQNKLTALLVDSPAKTSAMPGPEKDCSVNDLDCGSNLQGSFARWDQDSLSWKTWQRCLLEGWTQFSGRWPRSGTMRNGIVYRHVPLVPRISGIGFGSSARGERVPTPRCNTGPTKSQRHMSLDGYVLIYPTPTASDGSRGGTVTPNMTGASLPQYINTLERMWPTPTVRGNHNVKGMTKNSGDGLETAVKRYPTPCARDWRSGKGKTQAERDRTAGPSLPEAIGGQLNPMWVEWLMGFPVGWTDLQDSETPSSRK